MSFLGLDVGTTGCKAAIYSSSGKLLSHSYKQNDLIITRDRFELDPDKLWETCVSLVRETVARNNSSDKVEAISICTIGEAACPISTQGKPLHNIILHVDRRGEEFTADIANRIGKESLYTITGQIPSHIYTIFKILWYKKYMSDLFAKAHKFLLLEDYLLHKLGFRYFISHSLASRTLAFDITNKQWSQGILDSVGIDKSLFSDPVPTGHCVGELNSEMAKILELQSGIKVFSGGHDFMSSTLGAGVTEPGVALDNIATFEGIGLPADEFIVNKNLLEGNISINCFIDHKYLYIGYVSSSGSALKWFRETFCEIETEKAASDGLDPYDLVLNDIPDSPTKLLFLPHLVGSGTPSIDPNSKGALIGLTLDIDKPTVAKSILEGISFEYKTNIDLFKTSGLEINSLNASGGGAKSEKWLQIKADIYDTEIDKLGEQDTGCLGLAVICARSLNVYSTYQECIEKMVRKTKKIVPVAERVNKYKDMYSLYKQLYHKLKDINKCL